jgi:hypothetical protein
MILAICEILLYDYYIHLIVDIRDDFNIKIIMINK